MVKKIINNSGRGSNKNPRRKRTQKGDSAMNVMYRKARDFISNRYGGSGGVSNLVRDVAFLKGVINVEEKRIDSVLDVTVGKTAPVTSALSTLAQGDANNQRQGNSVKVIRFDVNFKFYYSSGTTTSYDSNTFRWFLVRYLKTPTTSPTTPFGISEFLDQDSNSQYTPISLPNTNTAQNFQIMASGTETVKLNFTATVSTTSEIVRSFTHECGFHQIYSGSASSTLTDALVVLVVVSSQNGNTGGVSGVTYGVRMWYVDN